MARKSTKKDTSWREPGVLAWLIGTFLFISAGFVFIYDPPSKIGIVEGTVVGLHQPQTEGPSPTSIMALLDSGETVRLGGSSRAPFRKGERVQIELYQTRIFHRNQYRFLQYVEVNDSTE